jgi:hypothetical protein
MLEIISILASLALLVLTPIQTAQICAGKFSPKMKVSPEAFVTAYRKQVNMLVWLGAVFAVLNFGMMFIPDERGEGIVKGVAAVLWVGVFGVSLYSRQRLAKLPAPAGGGGG